MVPGNQKTHPRAKHAHTQHQRKYPHPHLLKSSRPAAILTFFLQLQMFCLFKHTRASPRSVKPPASWCLVCLGWWFRGSSAPDTRPSHQAHPRTATCTHTKYLHYVERAHTSLLAACSIPVDRTCAALFRSRLSLCPLLKKKKKGNALSQAAQVTSHRLQEASIPHLQDPVQRQVSVQHGKHLPTLAARMHSTSKCVRLGCAQAARMLCVEVAGIVRVAQHKLTLSGMSLVPGWVC